MQLKLAILFITSNGRRERCKAIKKSVHLSRFNSIL